MSFQENLKYYREKANIKKADFARLLDLKYTTYDNYERGSAEPKPETFVKIANILNVSVDKLLGLQDNTDNLSETQLYRLAIRNRIIMEVEKQEKSYGDEKSLNPFQWLGLIQEELGETAQAVNERYLPDKHKSNKRKYGKYDIENEAYQTIALLFRFIEYLHKVDDENV